MNKRIAKIWKENKALVLFIAFMLVFRSAVADWNAVPTGSMQPTIVEGDRILVNKMAYDIRLPFTRLSLVQLSNPERGDIVVFDSQVSDVRLVKRVVGIPGDIVELKNNELWINGMPRTYRTISTDVFATDRWEVSAEREHRVRLRSTHSSFPARAVPENHYFVLGDNRDNSADSRAIGFVPRQEIVGRSRTVVFSLNYDNYHIPRSERFLHTL